MNLTPTPIDADLDLAGGGTPNAGAVVVTCPQNPPVSFSTQESLVTPFTQGTQALASLMPESLLDEDLDSAALERRWDGTLTGPSMRKLLEAVRAENWDRDRAGLVLQAMGDGLTLTKACAQLGISRGLVMMWTRLVPQFGAMVAQLQTDLGQRILDESLEETDPAMARVRIAQAAAFDRRIAKGDSSDVNVAQGITVTIQKFSTEG